MSQTTLNAHTSQPTQPPELAPYWDARITHDKRWYGEYVYPDSRFYDPHDDHVYRIDKIKHENTVFTLSPCVKAGSSSTPSTQSSTTPETPHYVNNICDLAGAIEAGDLIHLDKNTLRTVDETTFITLGEITLRTQTQTKEIIRLLNGFDTPTGATVEDIAKIRFALDETSTADIDIYIPEPLTDTPSPSVHDNQNTAEPSISTPKNATNIPTHWYDVQPFSKWTFESDEIRKWVESRFEPGETILNACAGKTKLDAPENCRIIRNDINEDRDADYHVDVAELASIPELQKESIDRIIFDPPWSVYQSNYTYHGDHVYHKEIDDEDVGIDEIEIDLSNLPINTVDLADKAQIGHARIAKEGFNWLLAPGGEVMEITQHGTSMPSRMGYKRVVRAIFDPLGEGKNVTGSVDRKMRQQLTDFN